MRLNRFIQGIAIIGKHLEKNEKYFRYPEKSVRPIVTDLENQIREIEKNILDWEKHLE